MNNSKKHEHGPIERPRFYSLLITVAALAFSLLSAGCGIDFNDPPRLATATARSAAPPAGQAEPLILPAPTGTPGSAQAETDSSATEAIPAITPISEGDGLVLWVDETSAEHKRVLDEIAAEFSDRYGTNMAVQLVSPAILPDLVSTGVLSGTLPDLILHPIEYTTGWAESGILDAAATDEVADRLGRETFDSAALELVTVNGQIAALPSDGFHQLLLYRADWFEELNLAVPDTYNAIAAAAERINNPEAIISGLVIPTESNLITTHQAFEQIALANGCRLIDENGEVLLLEPECAAALEQYYTTIHQFSPSGVQTDTSVAIAYLTGRTGIIMTSPAILPDLAGLNEPAMPTCPECVTGEGGVNYLAQNTGIVTEIRGPNGEPTSFGNIRNLGITSTADRAAAQAFAEFWFNEGYERWLAVDSERKVPMRLGTQSEPRRFIDAWGILPLGESSLSLTDIYGAEVVERLRTGIAAAPRWGIREGYGGLMTRLYDDYVISIVLQEMLSGYFDTTTTLREGYRRTIELIPNYVFPDRLAEETGEN
ncbi:MAG TPA: extracellular solute-binding protein [Promineifilum sp.]|nr:extracellular solute-binding protein [Promineifilum sp.]HRO23537.1 extracellular solute-binding protein [Promineifilum sp.]HRO89505.1 extracellular solute-binding protein [Promineifilum sp.]HRQ12289.1 extracellular solute-binding protein [Promineifilum sp.]